jgi:hypothetical protein
MHALTLRGRSDAGEQSIERNTSMDLVTLLLIIIICILTNK